MMTTDSKTETIAPSSTPVEALRRMLGEIELDVTTSYTLADAIREGSGVTVQAVGSYGADERACAMSAAVISARARGYLA